MLIVFDLDGTLIDSARDLAESASELAVSLGGRQLDVPAVTEMIGEGAATLVRRALQAAGADPATPHALTRFLEIYSRRLLNHTAPYDGVPAALAYARLRARLAVLTNKPTAPTLALLRRLHLDGFFDEVLGGDGPFPRKPDPAGFLALMRGAPGHPALLVGDSPIDYQTTLAAGCGFVFARYGFGAARFDDAPQTPYVLDRPADLPGIIERYAAIQTGL